MNNPVQRLRRAAELAARFAPGTLPGDEAREDAVLALRDIEACMRSVTSSLLWEGPAESRIASDPADGAVWRVSRNVGDEWVTARSCPGQTPWVASASSQEEAIAAVNARRESLTSKTFPGQPLFIRITEAMQSPHLQALLDLAEPIVTAARPDPEMSVTPDGATGRDPLTGARFSSKKIAGSDHSMMVMRFADGTKSSRLHLDGRAPTAAAAREEIDAHLESARLKALEEVDLYAAYRR